MVHKKKKACLMPICQLRIWIHDTPQASCMVYMCQLWGFDRRSCIYGLVFLLSYCEGKRKRSTQVQESSFGILRFSATLLLMKLLEEKHLNCESAPMAIPWCTMAQCLLPSTRSTIHSPLLLFPAAAKDTSSVRWMDALH